MKNLKFVSLIFALLMGVLLLESELTFGETWNVSNLTDFQTRLGEAASNNEDDVINVASGVYNLTA